MHFRKDINGLRAIAIIGVLLFHFNSVLMPGGFSGVDIFFVISGFLMTKIIYEGINSNSFSLMNFYSARCRRIIPALTILCMALLIFGWFNLNAKDFGALSLSGLSSIFFTSNILYWSQSSYFGAEAQSNWLLHTWSLSVEWQFYLLYPIIILLLKNINGIKFSKNILIALMLMSFVSSIYLTSRWPSMSFYLIPTRAWEMIAGGLSFFWGAQVSNKNRWIVESIGIALITFSFVYLNENYAWPSIATFIPVLGCSLILLACNQNSYITGNYIFQRIGDASYSIYLWHWPIVVYLHTKSLSGNYLYIVCGITGSLLLGFASYYIVERKMKSSSVKIVLTTASIVVLALFIVNQTGGADLDFRTMAKIPKSVYVASYNRDMYVDYKIKNSYLEQCNFFDGDSYKHKDSIDKSCTEFKGNNGIFIWGDSHAQSLGQGIRNSFTDKPVYQIASAACRPGIVPDTATIGEFKLACDESNRMALDLIEKYKPLVVVMAQRDNHEANDYKSIAAKLHEIGVKHVILVGPIPQYNTALPVIIAERHWDVNERSFKDPAINNDIFTTDQKMKTMDDQSNRYDYISLVDSLCQGKICLAKVDDFNTPLEWDYGHMTPEGSYYITKKYLYEKINNYLSDQ